MERSWLRPLVRPDIIVPTKLCACIHVYMCVCVCVLVCVYVFLCAYMCDIMQSEHRPTPVQNIVHVVGRETSTGNQA